MVEMILGVLNISEMPIHNKLSGIHGDIHIRITQDTIFHVFLLKDVQFDPTTKCVMQYYSLGKRKIKQVILIYFMYTIIRIANYI